MTSKRPKRVTIRDVAQAAGVSVGAASTALRNVRSNVVLSEATRQRILDAAKRLRYRPNSAARAMAGVRTSTIGVLTTEYCMGGHYYGEVLRGIANTAEARGFNLLLKSVPTKLDMGEASMITEQLVEGVVIPAEAEHRTREALHFFDIPHVWLNTELEEPHNCVHADEMHGLRLAVDHLVGLGHRRIAWVHHTTYDKHRTTIERERAYLLALRAHDLSPVPTYDRYGDVPGHVDVYLRQEPRPTALIVFSDAMMMMALQQLLRRGVRIPEEMSLISAEGLALSYFAAVPITHVRAPARQLGHTAVDMLVHQISTGEPPPSVKVPQALEVLESTAPPPPES